MSGTMTIGQFASLINQADILSDNRKLISSYNCCGNRKYTVVEGVKKDLYGGKFDPLSLNDIVKIGLTLEKESLNELKSVKGLSQAFSKMSASKSLKDENGNFLFRLIKKIIECICNFFHGFGFRTTSGAAEALAKRLETPPKEFNDRTDPIIDPPKDPGTPVKESLKQFTPKTPDFVDIKLKKVKSDVEQIDEVFKERELDDNPPLDYRPTTPSSKMKLKNVKQLVNNPENCPRVAKNSIFLEITSLTDEGSLDKAVSLEGLIQVGTGKTTIDFNDPKALILLKEYLKTSKKLAQIPLINWLMEGKHITPLLLKECLEILISKCKDINQFEPESLKVLLKYYLDNHYYKYIDESGTKILPSNHSCIVEAIIVTITESPNENKVLEMVQGFIKLSDYNLTTFCRMMSVFQKKEVESAKAVYFPLRDALIEDYKSRSEWHQEMKNRSLALQAYVNRGTA